MALTLSKNDLRADHKAALGTAAKKFDAANNADFDRHLNNALLALSRIRTRTLSGELSLISGECNYPAPSDCLAPTVSRWGVGVLKPWQAGATVLPAMSTYTDADNGLMITLNPAPNAFQIGRFGSVYPFFYSALHIIDEDAAKTTIKPSDRDLFLLLAAIEAMQELALSNVSEPITLHRGMASVPANSTPAAALDMLNKQLELKR